MAGSREKVQTPLSWGHGLELQEENWRISVRDYWEARVRKEEHAIAVDEYLAISIETKLRQAGDDELRRKSCPPTIHRVRLNVREEEPQCYEPQVVSLGPFHHGKAGLEEMEKLNLSFMNDLLRRDHINNSVEAYVEAVRKIASKARAQYSGDHIDFEPDAFVEMMVLDGCFIVECLVKKTLGSLESALTSATCNTTLLRNDFLLIENQIPFFVVEALFTASCINWRNSGFSVYPGLLDLATHLLNIENIPPVPPSGIHHLLHLFHLSLDPDVPPDTRPQVCHKLGHCLGKPIGLVSHVVYGVLYMVLMCRLPRLFSVKKRNKRCPRMIPCTTELRESGINMRNRHFKRKAEARSFLDVTFQDGTMVIPFLSVDSSTNSRFRNLVAFEQCCPRVGSYFTSYAIFMDNLVNTAADVAVLRSSGIMESKLGSDEEVAHMFNTICKGSHLDYENHHLAPLFRDVKTYCESSRHKWRAKLVHDYFSSPWAVVSVIVASILLIFTGLQAVFAVVAYFRPPGQ